MHRTLAALAGLAAVLAGCAATAPSRTFRPLGDYATSVPRSRAEAGHGAPIVPPPGVGWQLTVLGFPGDGRRIGSHYELRLELTDRAAAPGTWRIEPRFEHAELVDDEGARFPCTRALVPEPKAAAEVDPDELPARLYGLIFEVPGSYRFGRISGLVVHWSFALDGATVAVTTRFGSA